MKKFILISILFCIALYAFSQGAYTSVDNKKSSWEVTTTWNKQYSSMPDAPSLTNVDGTYSVNIYGYVTRTGNLSLTGSSVLNVYDTLVIKGNLTVASSIVVHSGGVLIIVGNFTGTSSVSNKLTNNGNVVVTGEFSLDGGTITSNSKVYSFDLTPTFAVGSGIDGVTYNGNNVNGMKNQLRTSSQLNSANAPLAGFVTSLLGALPIKLISFTGSVAGQLVSLNWVTARELNFDHFEVERASGDLAFEQIAQIMGSGYNTDDNHYYSYTDSAAAFTTNYYRLKSIDLDGSYEYSKIVGVSITSSKTISIYPNPSNGDVVNVSANFELDGHSEVMIFNQQGVLLQKVQITDREMQIDFTRRLSSGIYILRYTSPVCSHTIRLIVK